MLSVMREIERGSRKRNHSKVVGGVSSQKGVELQSTPERDLELRGPLLWEERGAAASGESTVRFVLGARRGRRSERRLALVSRKRGNPLCGVLGIPGLPTQRGLGDPTAQVLGGSHEERYLYSASRQGNNIHVTLDDAQQKEYGDLLMFLAHRASGQITTQPGLGSVRLKTLEAQARAVESQCHSHGLWKVNVTVTGCGNSMSQSQAVESQCHSHGLWKVNVTNR
ncbi:hypothetical protein ACOMHN_008234 [Nucella lapillus]